MFSYNWYFDSILRIIASPAILLFILISGYFSYNKKINLKLMIKKLLIPLLMLFPFLFYTQLMAIGGESFFRNLIKGVITFTVSYYHLWYIIVYIVLIMILPLIHFLLENYDSKYIIRLIFIYLVGIAVNSLLIDFFNISLFNNCFNAILLLFIVMYLIGYFINKKDIKISSWRLIIYLIVLYGFFYGLFIKDNLVASETTLAITGECIKKFI